MIHALIGSTPLIPLSRFCPACNLLAKAEFTNLTGSVKDRAAMAMIEDAQGRGLLVPGGTIIEPTSGNMGISLAAIAAAKGYRAIIVMPDSMSPERQQLMRAYGAQVVLTPGQAGMAGAVAKAEALAKSIPGSYLPGQFQNRVNVLAHYRTTGPEIWAQTQGNIHYFVAGVGTGGTITGIGQYLKEQDPRVKIIAVEPAGSPLLSRGIPGSHGIQGIGPNFLPEILDRSVLDGVICVSDDDAFATARALAQTEGIFAGISSGAAVFAAQTLARQHPDQAVVTLLPDSGSRYLSSGLFHPRD